jgi:drug/metabolite transporter (DMT)-like permease
MLLPQADPLQPATNWGIFRLITVGIAATAGQLFLTKAFASGPPTSVSIVGLSQVAVAAAFKWLIHWQPPSLLSILGMLLVMISTVWVMVERPDSSDEPTEL